MQTHDDKSRTIVVIGAGAVGAAIAHRQGAEATVVLADRSKQVLQTLACELESDGYRVIARVTDISVRSSVRDLANCAASTGRITELAVAVGVSSIAAPAEILTVNLQGVGTVLEAFGAVVSRGGSGVVVSSASGYQTDLLTVSQERALAAAWADELLGLPFTDPSNLRDPADAYAVGQRGVRILIQAAAVRWGWRGARVNLISRGVKGCLSHWRGADSGTTVIGSAPQDRSATPDDVAAAAAFLLGPEAAFITGVDLLVDGGVTAAVQTDQLALLNCTDPD